jgi:hypothetical protein
MKEYALPACQKHHNHPRLSQGFTMSEGSQYVHRRQWPYSTQKRYYQNSVALGMLLQYLYVSFTHC